jgi:hypothetical protein
LPNTSEWFLVFKFPIIAGWALKKPFLKNLKDLKEFAAPMF